MHAGEAADFQRKQNGNASRANYHRTETYSTRQGGILRPRAVRVWSNFSGTVGSGRQVPHRLPCNEPQSSVPQCFLESGRRLRVRAGHHARVETGDGHNNV